MHTDSRPDDHDRDVCYLNSGKLTDIEFSADSFLMCAAGWVGARSNPFAYELPENVRGTVRKSYAERVASRIPTLKKASKELPRLVFPDMAVRLTRPAAVGFLEELLGQFDKGSIDPVFWPNRIPSCRRMTAIIYELLQCAPDIMLLGAGMRDHVIDTRYGQPLISVDEYRHRLNWISRTVQQDFQCDLIFVLNPPVRDGVFEDSHEQESRELALGYADAAREEVTRFGGSVVDLSDITAPDGEFSARFRRDVRETVVKELASLIRTITEKRTGSNPDRNPPFQANKQVRAKVHAAREHAPFAAVVRFQDDATLPFVSPQAEKLLFSLRPILARRKIRDDDDDVEVDSYTVLASDADDDAESLRQIWASGKSMRKLGGRNEREAEIQSYLTEVAEKNRGNGLPRALIIGDSIRMRLVDGTGYGRQAYELLNDECELVHIPHNCGGSKALLIFLDDWLSTKPDIVHVNTGLHDLARVIEGEEFPAYAEIPEYQDNLRIIIDKIRASGCKNVIWGTNTPVQEEWHRWVPARKKPRLRQIVRSNADIRDYNAASVEVMEELDVPVTDMFAPLWDAGVENVILPDGVHLNHLGSTILGTLVAERVKEYL